MWRRASCDQTSEPDLHFVRATPAIARWQDDFVRPSAKIEFRVEEDRLAIKVSNENVIDLAAIDHPQNRYHGRRRIEPANIHVQGISRAPYPGAIL
jgi:hypothetical protein